MLALATAAAAQGTTVKPKAADYPVHARVGNIEIGAEYLVHAIPAPGRTYFSEDYLVIEVALYPPRGETIDVNAGAFTLRMNGKKQALVPQAPSFVAASLKYPEWTQKPRLEAGAGMGNAGVILGRPGPVERFPGDPTAQSRLPRPPRAPEPDNRAGTEKEPAPTADEAAIQSALPEGPARGPVSGYLYFAFKGKPKSIKSVELLFGNTALKLQ